MIGFDYTDRIAPAALKAAGCSVVFRYLSRPGWPKNLTAAEANELRAAGIPIVLNFETTADFMLGGYSAGVSCARSARAQANALGAPSNTRIYYSADFDATADQIPTILEFDRGAASVDGDAEVGGYGGLKVALAEDAAGYKTWQTVAWSNGQWDARSLARQTGQQLTVGGVDVDVNEIEDLAALGAWGGPSAPPAPAPSPTPSSTSEDSMALVINPIASGLRPDGTGAVTVILVPPPNGGAAGWAGVWLSMAADNPGETLTVAHLRVAAFIDGKWSRFVEDFVVDTAGPRVLPLGSPLPNGISHVSVQRIKGSEDVPVSYMVEARAK